MSQVIESYAAWLADFYLLTAVLLGLATAGCAALKQPAQQLAVSKSALVGLILLGVLSAIPGWSAIHLLTAQKPAAALPTLERAAPVIRPSIPSVEARPPMTTVEAASVASTEETPQAEKPSTPIQWGMVFCALHLFGAAIVVIWLLAGWYASRGLRRSARPAPPWLRALLVEVNNSHRQIAVAEVCTSEQIDVAVAMGVWRSMILLPVTWCCEPSPCPSLQGRTELRGVLAHEAAHVANGDLRWVAFMRVLLILLWAHPLFWLMRRRLRLDQEALADAAAAEVAGRQQYAEQLVSWARGVNRYSAIQLSSAVGLWEGPSQLRQRIAILLDEQLTVLRKCSRGWPLAAATLATGAAIGLSFITIQPGHTAPPDRSKPTNASATNPPSTGTLTIRFEYDGTPPAPKEIKEGGWRNKLDNRVMRTFNVEKRVGAKVFDESLVLGEDRGIANVLVWVRSRDVPVPSPQELPPVTITYKQGRLSPHVLAFQAPRRLVVQNEGLEAFGFHYESASVVFNRLVPKGEEESCVVKPERFPVRMTSNIEYWRSGIGYVLPFALPFVAVSDKNGVARIENLPPGKWEFQVWHELPGFVKTANWHMGRFSLDVKPGHNIDLGVVKLAPALFDESGPQHLQPETSTNAASGKQGTVEPDRGGSKLKSDDRVDRSSSDKDKSPSTEAEQRPSSSVPNRQKYLKAKKPVDGSKTADKASVDIHVVVARHVLLLEGKDIITWEELESKIAALGNPSVAFPDFYITHGAMESGVEKDAKPRIYELHRKYKLKGHSEGTLSARTSMRYDAIRSAADLTPDPALRVEGTVTDAQQKPVAGAEVVLITPVPKSLPYKAYDIAIVKGRLRNRLDDVVTDTDGMGRFVLYPPKGSKYFVLALHPTAGINFARGDTLVHDPKVHLLPWAQLSAELGPEPGAEQTASITTQIRADNGYPEVSLAQYWQDLNDKKPTNVFTFTHVPPITQTSIERSLAEPDGGMMSLNSASVSLLPGESRQINLGPMSEKQREHLKMIREMLDEQRKPRGGKKSVGAATKTSGVGKN